MPTTNEGVPTLFMRVNKLRAAMKNKGKKDSRIVRKQRKEDSRIVRKTKEKR